MVFLIIFCAIVPPLLVAYYIFRQDKHEREPRHQLAITYLAGLAITVPALYLEQKAASLGWDQTYTVVNAFLFAFIAVALVEETFKLLVLLAYPYRLPSFNEPLDGIVYSAMVGMGFATLENILYAQRFGLETALMRALTAVPAHGAFAVIQGYFVGLSKFRPESRNKLLLKGWGLSVLVHGVYDFFILQALYEWLVVLALGILGGGIFFARHMIRELQDESPYRKDDEVIP